MFEDNVFLELGPCLFNVIANTAGVACLISYLDLDSLFIMLMALLSMPLEVPLSGEALVAVVAGQIVEFGFVYILEIESLYLLVNVLLEIWGLLLARN